MKLSIGKTATGDNFFQRDKVIAEIYEALEEGQNLLLSAPRRVGKTSIIHYIKDNPSEDYYCVYVDTEDVSDSQTFFKVLLKAIFDIENKSRFLKTIEKAGKKLKGFFSSIENVEIGGVKIDFNDKSDEKIDYYEKFKDFLEKVDLDNRTILLMVDEFPVTIEHIRDEQGEQAARNFLKQNRAIRQNDKYNQKIKFIYTGSIGLLSVVKKLNATADVNDIQTYKLRPLPLRDALDLARVLLKSYQIETSEDVLVYLLKEKIEWLIPFHIQLAIKEIRDLYRIEEREVNQSFIDQAFNELILNGSIYLEHYRGRLSQVFNRNELALVHELLKKLTEAVSVSELELYDLAVKHQLEDSFKNILLTLEYDGYIAEANEKQWRFYSPILKKWWSKNV
ncbi:ATP-binding protein [Runella limosa]|uniref:ATP-binding protein n=1 Tax=Runella limosa TaxID=370978 RepID=UPI00041D2E4C|nr:ATP-binding protein [Runella limosa]